MGKLVIKEFPIGTCSSNRIRQLINDLQMYNKFETQILIIDYLNIMDSNDNSHRGNDYKKFTMISEELRALLTEYDLYCISSVQGQRHMPNKQLDTDESDIGDSYGIVKTADFIVNQIICKPETIQDLAFSENENYNNK